MPILGSFKLAESSIFEELIDPKVIKIIKLLLKSRGKLFHLQQVSHSSNVSMGTVFRIVPKLVKIGLVKQISVGKIKLYQVEENKKVQEIEKVLC